MAFAANVAFAPDGDMLAFGHKFRDELFVSACVSVYRVGPGGKTNKLFAKRFHSLPGILGYGIAFSKCGKVIVEKRIHGLACFDGSDDIWCRNDVPVDTMAARWKAVQDMSSSVLPKSKTSELNSLSNNLLSCANTEAQGDSRPCRSQPTPGAVGAIPADTDAGLEQALQLSEKDAEQQEQADVVEAVMRSNAEVRNSDGVQIVRLTSHSPYIKSHLLKSTFLQACFDYVRNADCEVSPSWANGALLLVPLSQEMLVEAGLELKAHNLVLLSSDKDLVMQALAELPKRKRPNVKPEHHADNSGDLVPSGGLAGSTGKSDSIVPGDFGAEPSYVHKEANIGLVVQHTFLHFRLQGLEVSESSSVVHSAPADTTKCKEHPNPRRWANK